MTDVQPNHSPPNSTAADQDWLSHGGDGGIDLSFADDEVASLIELTAKAVPDGSPTTWSSRRQSRYATTFRASRHRPW